MYCPECGKEIPEGSNYCGQCGTAIVLMNSTSTAASKTQRTNGMAIASMVLGLVGIASIICSIPAIVFGAIAMNQTGKDPNQKGRGMAIAGFVLGIVMLLFWTSIIILVIISVSLPLEEGGVFNNVIWKIILGDELNITSTKMNTIACRIIEDVICRKCIVLNAVM